MSHLIMRGARLHNLKNISLSLPKNQLIVFTGLSGSGKSTLVFDLPHKEGQRQYIESLGMVTYESRPPVDAITGLSPTISVGQNSANRSQRSTVGNASEVYTYLCVLFARTGHRPCTRCGASVWLYLFQKRSVFHLPRRLKRRSRAWLSDDWVT